MEYAKVWRMDVELNKNSILSENPGQLGPEFAGQNIQPVTKRKPDEAALPTEHLLMMAD